VTISDIALLQSRMEGQISVSHLGQNYSGGNDGLGLVGSEAANDGPAGLGLGEAARDARI
jgi:hypothetical protein